MDKSETITLSHNYLRLVLPLMSQNEVPITPENYTVWYRYVVGADQKLNAAIQKMIESNTAFTAGVNETLYGQFCADSDPIVLKRIRDSIQEILISIFSEIAGMNGHTEKYENVILNSVAKLSDNVSAEEIVNIVGQIIHETKEMARFGQTLQQKLTQANDELKSIKKQFEKAKAESAMDFLTGIPNKKTFNETLLNILKEANDENSGFCMLMMDIDNFKAFNDRHGHIVGDRVLRFVAQKTKTLLKGRDFIARFGGEEFVAILPQTDIIGASAAAKNIRQYFAQAELKSATTTEALGAITVSIGVACYRHGESADMLIERADQALYHAKKSGRNRVATEQMLL